MTHTDCYLQLTVQGGAETTFLQGRTASMGAQSRDSECLPWTVALYSLTELQGRKLGTCVLDDFLGQLNMELDFLHKSS